MRSVNDFSVEIAGEREFIFMILAAGDICGI